MSGMAVGSWFAGRLYDHFGYYAPAFGSGVMFNLGTWYWSVFWYATIEAETQRQFTVAI